MAHSDRPACRRIRTLGLNWGLVSARRMEGAGKRMAKRMTGCAQLRSFLMPVNYGIRMWLATREIRDAMLNGLIFLLATVALGASTLTVQDSDVGRDAPDSAATREECDVWVALGRHSYHWDQVAPNKEQFKIFYKTSSKGGYVNQCPWASYSIKPPPISSYEERGPSTGFSRPTFNGNLATVWIITAIPWGQGWGMNSEQCTLEKRKVNWVVRACVTGPMS